LKLRVWSKSLAIIGTGVQARSHLEALSKVHQLRQVTVWSPNKERRDQFVAEAAREHLRPAVVSVEAGLRDEDLDRSVGHEPIVPRTSCGPIVARR
jgi:ornithine cyclodeaminase/alanine dehydrogenase-like protein (mu-crystallin family)